MKATGVVRRIDELGRIVIPKEIRKILRIKNNDNMDIYIDENNNIILKKFSIINNIADFAQLLADTLYSFLKANIIITDNSNIIAYAGENKKDYLSKEISPFIEKAINRRDNILEKYQKEYQIVIDKKECGTYILMPIIASGDVVGMIITTSKEALTELDEKIIKIGAQFLGKYLED
ncbi:MAG: stage V sporulation T C-terminal domain-containing protein [Bacilli bacterium]|nr:stage V sporulation T C-terminal domain-containing protein [Bacilli bacterium]